MKRCREKWECDLWGWFWWSASPEPSLVTIPLNSVSKTKPYDQHQLGRTLHHIFHRIGLVGPHTATPPLSPNSSQLLDLYFRAGLIVYSKSLLEYFKHTNTYLYTYFYQHPNNFIQTLLLNILDIPFTKYDKSPEAQRKAWGILVFRQPGDRDNFGL